MGQITFIFLFHLLLSFSSGLCSSSVTAALALITVKMRMIDDFCKSYSQIKLIFFACALCSARVREKAFLLDCQELLTIPDGIIPNAVC